MSEITTQVLEAFHRYEQALVAGDVEVMTASFVDSPEVVRFGIADQQVGAAELTQWRRHQPPLPSGRRLFDTRVVPIGADAAVVTTLFGYPGSTATGRQSQTWMRTECGWQVIHAHVSVIQ